ncbi:MAG: hypothetical protein V2I97_23235 [Desulfococcaceae bacterium]|jgi:hypothetical protein|nr:hypothetical protein [Desulfococcaceae bacterium]
MKEYLTEKIGNPDLFTGRKKELEYLLKWAEGIRTGISKSTALLSRRKTGKTALLQRLYNILFHKNENIIPFYIEITEGKKWKVSFAREYFLTFVFQYIAFKSRKREYTESPKSYKTAAGAAQKEKLDYLVPLIENVERINREKDADLMWETVRESPRFLSRQQNEHIVHMIDEFQFLNAYIYRDEQMTQQTEDFTGSFFHTCEYRIAPFLVSGSWVGWLMTDIHRLLPGRFRPMPLGGLPEEEAVEMVYKYSFYHDLPVTENTTYLIAQVSEGSPFYISELFSSQCEYKDFRTEEGVLRTLEFETLHPDGSINATWMEYIESAFSRINDVNAKKIVFYLSKNRDRAISRKELREALHLDMSETALEKKLRSLYRSDIIEEDRGFYRGVGDNIFDKVLRRTYSDDIDHFVAEEAPGEYRQLFENLGEKYRKLSGEYNHYKGAWAEFMMIQHLRSAHQKNEYYQSITENLPRDFAFVPYDSVWSYTSPPLHEKEFRTDVYAKAAKNSYSVIAEVKNRKNTKFSLQECRAFAENAAELQKIEKTGKAVLFVFSACGLTKDAQAYAQEHRMAWSADRRWMDTF